MASPRMTTRTLTQPTPQKQRQQMAGTPSKRQKFRQLFNENDDQQNIDNGSFLSSFNSIKTMFKQTDKKSLRHDDIISALIIIHGFPVIARVLAAISHIPVTFADRLMYLCNIINVDKPNMTMIEIKEITDLLLEYATEHKFSVQLDDLWKCSFTHSEGYLTFLVPPVNSCLNCGGHLYDFNKIEITLFTLEGPMPGMKTTKRCKKGCLSTFNIDRYYVPKKGTMFYKTGNPFICISNCAYMTKDVHELMCESGNHAFVSHHAFSEIYNAVFSTSRNSRQFQKWLDAVKKDFNNDVEDVLEVAEEGHLLVKQDTGHQHRYILSRKKAINAYLNGEMVNELQERQDEIFIMSQGENRETIMKAIDASRRQAVYPHRYCGTACKAQGCGTLRVIDSCWKVCMPHCMFAVEMEVEGMPLLNFPNVCTTEPKPMSVFCEHHHKLLVANKVPTKKEDFLKYIGCNARPFSQADIKQVDNSTIKLARKIKNKNGDVSGSSSADRYQGISDVVANVDPRKWESMVQCNKDTGEKSRLRQRSRGHFISVTGGGHIQYFEPIFKSESPSQIFLIEMRVMMLELSKFPEDQIEEAIDKFVLSYDNMCQLDALKASKEPLPLPSPYDTMWMKIKKIIDRLHIANHKNEQCHIQYNPDQVPQEYNTMVAEQTFAWFSRFKKIVNSMSQTHHMFYIHRNIKRRNNYTERCRMNGTTPLLPGINTHISM